MEDIKRIKELTALLNNHRDAYYNSSKPEISDYEYDTLYDELKSLENKTGILFNNSPTQSVGYEVKSKLEKVTHNHPMLSLDKTKSVSDLIKFAGDRDYLLSLKMDGCFTGKTRITMADGTSKYIKDIMPDDKVLSFDENTNKLCESIVVNKFENGMKEYNDWNQIELYGENIITNKYKITCTKNHKLYTPNGFVESSNLNVGDKVYIHKRKLSQEQESVLTGILLGDGWFANRNIKSSNPKLEIHYAKTKNNEYEQLLYDVNKCFAFGGGTIRDRTSGYSSIPENMTDLNLHIMEVPQCFYDSKNQLRCGLTFTNDICKHLSPLALALFYLDDGSKIQCRNDGCDVFPIKNSCLLHTNRHKFENVQVLSNYLQSIGISNTIRFEKPCKNKELGDGYIIYIDTNGTGVFFDMIAKYIPKQFRERKLGLLDKWQKCEEVVWCNDNSSMELCETTICRKENGFHKSPSQINRNNKKESFDLEIDGTHTYFANGMAVHNCTTLLTYEDGRLIQAETRGNGEVGELITHNAKVFENIPLTINYPGHLEVEGEAIITYEDFEKINSAIQNDNEKYKNPRNLVSGSVRQLDSEIAAKRHIRFVCWKVPTNEIGDTMTKRLSFAESLGFDVVPYVYTNDLEHMDFLINNLKNIASENGYPIDGLVMTYDDILYGNSLGMTGHHPKHSIALKFYDEEVSSILIGIDWTMGKTGCLTPTAMFEPVEIEGTTVERASLHNVSILKELQLGIGDEITVYKANSIIPQLRENLTKSNIITVPDICPVCGGKTEIAKENDTEVLICTNNSCKGKLLGKLTHAVSKNALNVDGLSEATIEKFIELGWLNSIIDIYHLRDHVDQIMKLEGFGKASVNKLLEAIEKSRDTTLERFIYALSINLIGRTASKSISKVCCGDYNSFIMIISLEVENAFTGIDGFGKEMNHSLISWWNKNKEMITRLKDEFVFEKKTENSISGGTLVGKNFCITSKLNHFKNRDALVSDIESKGGKFVSSVSKTTDYLINDDNTSNSSKNVKATTLNIPIITEKEYIELSK